MILIRTITLTLSIFTLSACSFMLPKKYVTADNVEQLCTPLLLKRGQTAVITLETNRFTGYHWHIEQDGAPIMLLEKATTQKTNRTTDNPARQNTQTWIFRALAKGQTTLSFIYKLDWDNNVNQAQRFQCRIDISS